MNRHYFERMLEKLIFLEVFNSSHFSDMSLAQWLANTPKEVIQSILNLPDDFIRNLKKERCPVVKYPGFEFPYAKGTPQNIRYFQKFDFRKKEVKLGSSDVMGMNT